VLVGNTILIGILRTPGGRGSSAPPGWGGRQLLAQAALAGHAALRGRELVEVPEGEEYAANCIRVNNAVLIASGFPKTQALVRGLGHDVLAIDVSEYRKMDGGLSCLSVRW
jgi:dimethylargininase